MRFASLGSGSEGNGLVVEAADGTTGPVRVLVDCGFGLRETERRLARLGLAPAMLDAIVVTHEHGDHIDGVFRLARRHGIPVWASHGTLQSFPPDQAAALMLNVCCSHTAFVVKGLSIHPYPVPHDAREPTQFVFDDGRARLGVLTDAGRSTAHIVSVLSGCTGLVLECNHDRDMLANSDYPWMLKQRIGGAYGHLANETAAAILGAIDRSALRHVVAAHLSRQNNRPELARRALCETLGGEDDGVVVADQSDGFGWIVL